MPFLGKLGSGGNRVDFHTEADSCIEARWCSEKPRLIGRYIGDIESMAAEQKNPHRTASEGDVGNASLVFLFHCQMFIFIVSK